jgi:site-specific DNA-methyltransferase (adenine-specific)
MTIEILNIDCMEYMRTLPDKAFELAIVDPPYGIGISSNPVRQQHVKKQWDNETPSRDYFTELMRVSKNQIIWGG